MGRLLISRDTLFEVMYGALTLSTYEIPADVEAALKECCRSETGHFAKLHLSALAENMDVARKERSFVCSDTGWPVFYARIGDNVCFEGGSSSVYGTAREVVMRATEATRLRPTLVHPLTRVNPGTNVGYYLPDVRVRFDPHIDFLELTAVPKGGGGELYGTFYKMLVAADGTEGVVKFALDSFLSASYAGQTCPPNVIGLGIGGTSEICMEIAKEAAVLRQIGDRHPEPLVAELEEELLQQLNRLGVGPMGTGGRAVLDVHIELAMTHSGALPVAFVAQCAAARRATGRVLVDGSIEYGGVPEWNYRDRAMPRR